VLQFDGVDDYALLPVLAKVFRVKGLGFKV
jgi:hypothetical protein